MRNKIFKSRIPPHITEADIRKDKENYHKAMLEHADTIGVPRPLHKYMISEILADDFIVIPDPVVEEENPIDLKEEKERKINTEVMITLSSSIELMLNWIADQPNAPRDIKVARSAIAEKRKELTRL